MQDHQFYDSVNIMAIAAARASLSDAKHVSQGQRLNREVKKYVYAALDKLGYRYIPSHTNFMMINLRREVKPVIAALQERQVEVGRFFPALPNFLRVTIGTQPQMDAFLTTLRAVVT
jgi:histidinol-phosphate aminotransferase